MISFEVSSNIFLDNILFEVLAIYNIVFVLLNFFLLLTGAGDNQWTWTEILQEVHRTKSDSVGPGLNYS